MARAPARSVDESVHYLNTHGARVAYDPAFLAEHEARELLPRLLAELEFDAPEVSRMRQPFTGRWVELPRRQAGYGDSGTAYAFSGSEVPARPWTPLLRELRARLRQATDVDPNYVLANLYRNGADHVGWHTDDERDLGPEPLILSLSFGATRDFQFRRRGEAARAFDTVSLPLVSGSLLVMRHPTNASWKHQLPRRGGKRPERVGPRLNLTWRWIHR